MCGYIQRFACIALLSFTGCSVSQSDPTSQITEPAAPQFWDEIPKSPSTTMPERIVDTYWHGQFQRVNREVADADQPEIVFFGDSITWHWSLGAAVGKSAWERNYAPRNAINMGNSGDITPVMLYRVTHGNLDFSKGQHPKVAVLLCGTNNFVVSKSAGGKVVWELSMDTPPAEVANGARAVAQVFRRKLPYTRVIMLGVFPVANEKKQPKVQAVNAINAALKYNTDEVIYLDIGDAFLKPDGSVDRKIVPDGTHPNAEGYERWVKRMDPLIEQWAKAPPLDPVKIMHVGGSITEGASSAQSYRRYLDGMLRREGHLIDFIGSRDKHLDGSVEPDSYEFDTDHEGYWGKPAKWVADQLPRLLKTNVPDIAVVNLGTDDLVLSDKPTDDLAEEVVLQLDRIVEALRKENPGVKIVLSKIIPIKGNEKTGERLNKKLAKRARQLSASHSPVVWVDHSKGFDPLEHLADNGQHPSPAGAKLLAEHFAQAINDLLDE